MHQSNRRDTLDICSRNGFAAIPVDDGWLITCGTQGAAEVVKMYKNGALEHRNTGAVTPVVTKGMSVLFLKHFFHARELGIFASTS